MGKYERLVHEAQIIHYALSKLSQGKDVSTEVLGKICETLNCTIDDIMEFVPEEEK
ncbi:MAG: helix-turn-helix transcriptional regulator [Lachnospiraceae bacterium]|nr:helix-turn-helix transcriptional regulator [Lachnospiraceae bacterium]